MSTLDDRCRTWPARRECIGKQLLIFVVYRSSTFFVPARDRLICLANIPFRMIKTIQTCHISKDRDVIKRVVSFKSVLELARCKRHMFDEVLMKRNYSSVFKLLIITLCRCHGCPISSLAQASPNHDRHLTWGEAISAQRTTITQSHETIRHLKNNIAAFGSRVRIRRVRIRRAPGRTC